jgi:hypothetical protein
MDGEQDVKKDEKNSKDKKDKQKDDPNNVGKSRK